MASVTSPPRGPDLHPDLRALPRIATQVVERYLTVVDIPRARSPSTRRERWLDVGTLDPDRPPR